MEKILSNTVKAVGNYNDIPTSITSAATVVTMISGLTITKTADKQVWADGNLTYTIIIENKSDNSYNAPEIKDVLDENLIEFVQDSVTIDGQKASSSDYEFDSSTSTLTINLTDIAVSTSKTVTFEVSKKNS